MAPLGLISRHISVARNGSVGLLPPAADPQQLLDRAALALMGVRRPAALALMGMRRPAALALMGVRPAALALMGVRPAALHAAPGGGPAALAAVLRVVTL